MKNFSEWFHNILEEAELMDARYPVKGMSVWLPRGFKIRKYSLELLQKLLDEEHEETLFPMLIPESELAKEAILSGLIENAIVTREKDTLFHIKEKNNPQTPIVHILLIFLWYNV